MSEIRPIRHLLLVEGPSASGKSTFLEQLEKRNLPPHILEHLPCGVDSWRRIGVLIASDLVSAEGLIRVADDCEPTFLNGTSDRTSVSQALKTIQSTGAVTIVRIRPSGRQLMEQFCKKKNFGMEHAKSPRRFIAHRYISRSVPSLFWVPFSRVAIWTRSAIRPMYPRQLPRNGIAGAIQRLYYGLQKKHGELLKKNPDTKLLKRMWRYSRESNIDKICDDWDKILNIIINECNNCRIITVQPQKTNQQETHPNWQIVNIIEFSNNKAFISR